MNHLENPWLLLTAEHKALLADIVEPTDRDERMKLLTKAVVKIVGDVVPKIQALKVCDTEKKLAAAEEQNRKLLEILKTGHVGDGYFRALEGCSNAYDREKLKVEELQVRLTSIKGVAEQVRSRPDDGDLTAEDALRGIIALVGDVRVETDTQIHRTIVDAFKKRVDDLTKACEAFIGNSEACTEEFEARLKAEKRVKSLEHALFMATLNHDEDIKKLQAEVDALRAAGGSTKKDAEDEANFWHEQFDIALEWTRAAMARCAAFEEEWESLGFTCDAFGVSTELPEEDDDGNPTGRMEQLDTRRRVGMAIASNSYTDALNERHEIILWMLRPGFKTRTFPEVAEELREAKHIGYASTVRNEEWARAATMGLYNRVSGDYLAVKLSTLWKAADYVRRDLELRAVDGVVAIGASAYQNLVDALKGVRRKDIQQDSDFLIPRGDVKVLLGQVLDQKSIDKLHRADTFGILIPKERTYDRS